MTIFIRDLFRPPHQQRNIWFNHYRSSEKCSRYQIKTVTSSRAIENWKDERQTSSWGQNLTEIRIQEESSSPLLFLITTMSSNYRLRKGKRGYKFTKSSVKVNHIVYMKDVKIFNKNENEQKLLYTHNPQTKQERNFPGISDLDLIYHWY